MYTNLIQQGMQLCSRFSMNMFTVDRGKWYFLNITYKYVEKRGEPLGTAANDEWQKGLVIALNNGVTFEHLSSNSDSGERICLVDLFLNRWQRVWTFMISAWRHIKAISYMSHKIYTGFVTFCFVAVKLLVPVVCMLVIYLYSSWLLHWHWGILPQCQWSNPQRSRSG